ncbi:hypothetical protein H2O64_00415 [Kordia sp. YSTF-M3]|uniref:Uncharacterized protein n=1 Tax=Kordia aestuariivivens TaxID=2759037 RepID=A0ABR7Q3T0_9FLAO|nr:hypothetical protein [Kordia aestuariivivens]MBC8753113.1 hypothetical protein [Kordia aestuariivivens]
MKIQNRTKLQEWLDQNYWFENGFISEIKDSKNELEIVVGYQTVGTYVAGEKQELKEFSLKTIGLTNWTYKKEQFSPTRDSCINGIDLTEKGFGLKFDTESVFEMTCDSLEISNPKIIQTYTKPWTSNREIQITATQKEVPTVNYWVEKLEEYGIKIGFRYFSSELIKSEKVPYPDYSGYFIQTLNKISETQKGLFFKFIDLKNGELRIGIENEDENEKLFKTIQLIVSDWKNTTINSGNVKFIGKEFKEFLKNGKYPERIEKIKDVW